MKVHICVVPCATVLTVDDSFSLLMKQGQQYINTLCTHSFIAVLLLSSHEPYRHRATKNGTSTWVGGSVMVEASCRGRFMFPRRRRSRTPRHQLCMCGRPLTELHPLKVVFAYLLAYLPAWQQMINCVHNSHSAATAPIGCRVESCLPCSFSSLRGLAPPSWTGSHHHEWDFLWARSPLREWHIRWQIWHSKLLLGGAPDLRRSCLDSNSWMHRISNFNCWLARGMHHHICQMNAS